MKYIKTGNQNYDNVVMTPEPLARAIVEHLKPSGKLLEPCRGTGNFYRAMLDFGEVDWCEISEGRDFLDYEGHVDWIITNPPWSKGMMLKFLDKSLEVADNIAFLSTLNHFTTSRRLRDIIVHNFGYKEIILVDTPENFPISGFQVGVVHLKRDYKGPIEVFSLMQELPR